MIMTENKINIKYSKAELIAEAWRRGNLAFKCHKVQKEMYDIFYNAPKRSRLVWVLARQSGKTVELSILALEQAIREPNSIIKFVTDTKSHAETILLPIFNELLLKDCPEDLKPEYKVKQYTYFFPNGSQIQLAGTDNKHYEKLRGQKAHLVLIDEAGFCNDLEDVIESVLYPTTTHTGGKIVIASTIPEQLDHPFLTKYIPEAEFEGTKTEKTIDDNPLLNKEQVEEICKRMGGRTSIRFRREYLNEIVKDSNISVIPEFTKELENEIIKPWVRPPFYHGYVSMDLGGKDLTAVLFAYYDFKNGKLVIEDELIIDFQKEGNNLEVLTKQIIDKENELWYDQTINELKKPYKRVSDINPIAINEILKYSYNQIAFGNANKDDKDSAINYLRHLIGSRQIIINPKCKNLILHLRNVRWNSPTNKEKFARSPDHGHYDAVDALKYMVRSVDFDKNPYPPHYGINRTNLYVNNTEKFKSSDPIEVYRKIFGIKRKPYGR